MSSGISPRKVDSESARGLARPAVVEEFGPVAACGADVVAHVLHDPEDRHVDLLKHVDAPCHVEQGDILRRRDDHRAGERHPLRHGELRIAGAGRQVAEQHVELAPIDVPHHLLQRLHHHRSTPDHGGILGNQKADGHALDPVIRHGAQRAFAHHLGLAAEIEHARNRRPVDVAVEQTDSDILGGHRGRDVDGGGRLADSALAGCDGDDALHPWQELIGLRRPRLGLPAVGVTVAVAMRMTVALSLRLAARWSLGGQHGRHRKHAGEPLHRSLARLSQRLLRRALVRIDLQREAHVAVSHNDSADEAARDHVLSAVRVQDVSERRQNLILGDRRHRSTPTGGSRQDATAGMCVRRCVPQPHDL